MTDFKPVTEALAALHATVGTWLWMDGKVRIVARRRREADGWMDERLLLWLEGDPQPVIGDTGQTVYVIEDHNQVGLREFMVAHGYRFAEGS